MVNLLPIGKAIWEFSKPAVVIAGQVMVGIGTAMAIGKAIDGVGNGIRYLRGTKQPVVRKAKKRSNSKKASGNRKAKAKAATKKTVRKSTKSTALGEKSTVLNS